MYGELLDQASTHLATATLALAQHALTSEAAARDAVTAHGRLLTALRVHTAHLLGGYPERIAGVRRSAHPDPRDLAAVQMLDALNESAPPDCPVSAPPRTEPALSWTAAARALGAAGDLLATQRDSHGRWRSPEAWLLDEPDVRAAGLREIASVALVVAGAADQLRLHLRDWNVDGAHLAVIPDLARLQVASTATRYLGDTGVESHDLRGMALARPEVRIGDPLIELADRVERLRCVAWQLTRVRSVGVPTLQCYAALGTIVCEHLRQDSPAADPGLIGEVRRRGDAWRRVQLRLQPIRSTAVGIPGIYADVVAVRHALTRLREEHVPRAGVANVQRGVVEALDQIASWNDRVVCRLDSSGLLLMPARLLRGDDVTDVPNLARAKLAGELIPVPPYYLRGLRSGYKGACSHDCDRGPDRAAGRQIHAPHRLHESRVL
jgi:hypothetical protein